MYKLDIIVDVKMYVWIFSSEILKTNCSEYIRVSSYLVLQTPGHQSKTKNVRTMRASVI